MRIEGIGARRKRVTIGAIAGLLAAALCGAAGNAAAQAPAGAEPGVWQGHKLQFNYLGGVGVTYSCDGMQRRIRELLSAMGTAPGFTVTPGGCPDFGTPTTLIYMRLEFQSLKPLAGAPSADGAAPPATVPGVWRHVTFRRLQPYDFGGGDCELVDDFRAKVMPLFATRNVKASLNCVPYQQDAPTSSWSLSFDVFAPLGPKGGDPSASPAGT